MDRLRLGSYLVTFLYIWTQILQLIMLIYCFWYKNVGNVSPFFILISFREDAQVELVMYDEEAVATINDLCLSV